MFGITIVQFDAQNMQTSG